MSEKTNTPQLQYPDSFIQDITQFFKDSPDIVEKAKNHDYSIGVILNDLYDETIEPDEVLRQLGIGEKGIAELKTKAKKLYETKRLYSQWAFIVDSQLDMVLENE